MEDGDGRVPLVVLGPGILGALVGGHGFWRAVAVEVGEEHADVRPAVARHGQHQARPRRGAWVRAGILEVDEVGEFRRDHDVEVAVAVHVGEGGVFGCRRFGPLRQGDVRPRTRVVRGEGDAYVPVGLTVVARIGLMDGDHVLEAVPVKVPHREAVAAAERNAGGGRIVDEMFAPADEQAVGRARGGRGIRDGPRGLVDGPRGFVGDGGRRRLGIGSAGGNRGQRGEGGDGGKSIHGARRMT